MARVTPLPARWRAMRGSVDAITARAVSTRSQASARGRPLFADRAGLRMWGKPSAHCGPVVRMLATWARVCVCGDLGLEVRGQGAQHTHD